MLKSSMAPVALPKREFMENAKVMWNQLGLPPLAPEPPWRGYDLGHWPKELERQADTTVRANTLRLAWSLPENDATTLR